MILCFALSALPLVSASEDYWTTMEPMPTARSGLGIVVVNGRIYAIGGTTASGYLHGISGGAVLGYNELGGHVGTNEEYDPATDTWTPKVSMPTPRIVFATTAYQNKIYCIGGKTADGFTGANKVYDPERTRGKPIRLCLQPEVFLQLM